MWDDSLPNDWWSKWVLGTAVPVVLAVHGGRCMIAGRAWLPGARMRNGGFGGGRGIELHGGDAITFAVAVLAIAALMHVHYLWNNLVRLQAYVNPAQHVGLVILVGAIVVLIGRVPFAG